MRQHGFAQNQTAVPKTFPSTWIGSISSPVWKTLSVPLLLSCSTFQLPHKFQLRSWPPHVGLLQQLPAYFTSGISHYISLRSHWSPLHQHHLPPRSWDRTVHVSVCSLIQTQPPLVISRMKTVYIHILPVLPKVSPRSLI